MKVAIVVELFPSPADPVQGIWALRQAQAVQQLDAEIRVLALRRPIPPSHALRPLVAIPPRTEPLNNWLKGYRAAMAANAVEGVPVKAVRFFSPPRPISYGAWGHWARLPLGRALGDLNKGWPFDLVHAHYAAPAGYAVKSWCRRNRKPLACSLHGGDLLNTARRSRLGRMAVASTLRAADAVLCNSRWTLERATAMVDDSSSFRVVHLGTDRPDRSNRKADNPTLVTVANLDPRKRHEDVLQALAILRDRLPRLRYLIVGDGPYRHDLEVVTERLNLSDRVEFAGRLPQAEALTVARQCHLFVMPSVDEAFGVAYIEAMAGGLPVIGCHDEGGPEEIARIGSGVVLVPPRNPQALARQVGGLFADAAKLTELGDAARETVANHFSWERCGRETVAVYQDIVTSGKKRSP